MINLDDFKQSVHNSVLPADLSLHLQALWHDGIGDWKTAHDLIDQLNDKPAAHVHAYLHRKEGDLWNADYWYKRAGENRPQASLDQEWEALVEKYLS